ncbi:MAG: PD-(D/E)XK nuclease family protein [Actinobacteria bacterium]|nr:PD-(D/E)XK nuclease family protein [Actinomycetota bacterium]
MSFSQWALYNKCPASYEWQYVLGHKREFVAGGAAARGTRIHDSIEQRFLQDADYDDEIPQKIIDTIEPHYRAYKNGECDARPELPIAVTHEWQSTSFEADDAMLRGFIDNSYFYPEKVILDEYKTGQVYDEHVHQKQLYAGMILSVMDGIEEVVVRGIYIDKKKVEPTTYSRAHLPAIQFTWETYLKKMKIPMYPANPGMHCRWCPKSSKHGDGPCNVG